MPLAITYTKLGAVTWQALASGTAPYVIYDVDMGEVIDQMSEDSIALTYHGDGEEPPALEWRDADDTGKALTELFDPRVTLQWRGSRYANYYIVQHFVSSAWTRIGVMKDDARGYYQFTTDPLTDGATHQFRVIPYDFDEDAGAHIDVEIFMVRYPPVPLTEVSYDEGDEEFTVAARA